MTAPGKAALEVHGIRSRDGIVRGVDLERKVRIGSPECSASAEADGRSSWNASTERGELAGGDGHGRRDDDHGPP